MEDTISEYLMTATDCDTDDDSVPDAIACVYVFECVKLCAHDSGRKDKQLTKCYVRP